jgi:hypothetical protein
VIDKFVDEALASVEICRIGLVKYPETLVRIVASTEQHRAHPAIGRKNGPQRQSKRRGRRVAISRIASRSHRQHIIDVSRQP